jgi:hypothetical protein
VISITPRPLYLGKRALLHGGGVLIGDRYSQKYIRLAQVMLLVSPINAKKYDILYIISPPVGTQSFRDRHVTDYVVQ